MEVLPDEDLPRLGEEEGEEEEGGEEGEVNGQPVGGHSKVGGVGEGGEETK